MIRKKKFHGIYSFFVLLFCMLHFNPAYAKNVEFSEFSGSCPQMAAALTATERKINALRLSDKEFLRTQLVEYQALSQLKTSGSACEKIREFFAQQANNTRDALRNRVASASARATQAEARLNTFANDMETLSIVLGGVSQGLAENPNRVTVTDTDSKGYESGKEPELYWHGKPKHCHPLPGSPINDWTRKNCNIGHLH